MSLKTVAGGFVVGTAIVIFLVFVPIESEETRCTKMCGTHGVHHFMGSNGGCQAVQCICRDDAQDGGR